MDQLTTALNQWESSISSKFSKKNRKHKKASILLSDGSHFFGTIHPLTGRPAHGIRTCPTSGEVYDGPFVVTPSNYQTNNVLDWLTGQCVVDDKISGRKFVGLYSRGKPVEGTRMTPAFTYVGTFDASYCNNTNNTACRSNNDSLYCFHGSGKLVYLDGTSYEGEFHAGEYHGIGTLRTMIPTIRMNNSKQIIHSSTTGTYTGSFVRGKEHGIGSFTERVGVDGAIIYEYSGVWSLGVKEGEGSEIRSASVTTNPVGSTILIDDATSASTSTSTSCKETYTGQFHQNKRHGQGCLTNFEKDSQVMEGPFRAGLPMHGPGWQITFSDGNKYSGSIDDQFRPHGSGMMVYASTENIYTGEFRHGVRHGEGLCMFSSGESYEGSWINDEPQGLQLFEQEFSKVLAGNGRNNGNGDHSYYRNSMMRSTSCNTADIAGISSTSCEAPNVSLIEVSIEDRGHDDDDGDNNEDKHSHSSKSFVGDIPSIITESLTSSVGMCFSIPEIDDVSSDVGDNDDQSKGKLPLHDYPNGDTFRGCLDAAGHRQGFGRYTEHCSRSQYEGQWKDNLRYGKGVLIAGNIKYCGDFVHDRREGEGTLISNDASSYRGQFKDGLFHGHGTLCNDDGSVYDGEWANGKKHGVGKFLFPDKAVYSGEFRKGKFNGIGTLRKSAKGHVVYSGEWKDGLMDGEGTRFYQESSKWATNEPTKYAAQYTGVFIRGQRSGHGTLTTIDNISMEGTWLRDNPVSGDWKIQWVTESSSYSGNAICPASSHVNERGSVSGGKLLNCGEEEIIRIPIPSGEGVMQYRNGDVYTGGFADGQRQGKGICVFVNGEQWEGAWSRDTIDMDGDGALRLADGTVHTFSDGGSTATL